MATKTPTKKASKTAPAGADRAADRKAAEGDTEAANAVATREANVGAAGPDREGDHQTGTRAPNELTSEETADRAAALQLSGGPISLSPEGTAEVLGRLRPEEEQPKAKKHAKPDSRIGKTVLFTRIVDGAPVVSAGIITGVHAATKAEGESLSKDEAAEVAGLSTHDLDERNLARADDGTVTRRFPRPAEPESVDLHIFQPTVGAPVQFVERVPEDSKGEQDVSYREV